MLACLVPAPFQKDTSLHGLVLLVDRFGNLITNIREDDLPRGRWVLEIGGKQIAGLSPSYSAASDLLAIIGSAGYLEIAQNRGSAASTLGLGAGAEVSVRS
jgi:S-adenosylmethionine hydrolase